MKVKEYLNNQELSSDDYMSEEEIKKEMNNQVTAVKINTAVVGKDDTKGLQKPRFRLYSGEADVSELMVAHYGVSPRFVNQQPEVEVTNVYRVVDILNEYIDEYHDKHKED